MIVICKKCGYKFESLILNHDVAFEDINKKFNRHIEQKHADLIPELQQAMRMLQAALVMAVHYTEWALVPDNQDEVHKRLQKARDVVMVGIGFEPEETEEEEEEEDDGEEEEPLEVEPGEVVEMEKKEDIG
jgi:hypothetical protein